MKLLSKHAIAAFGLIFAFVAAPTTASASGRVHIDVPGISIGYYGDHGYRHKKHYKRKYRNNYYNDYRYNKRRYNKRRYDNRRYRNNYYYGGSRYNNRYDNRYNSRDRYYERCPIAGFSLRIDDRRDCYEHKGHYHCE